MEIFTLLENIEDILEKSKGVPFSNKVLVDKEEILDVKWFDYDEIVNKMESMLRGNYVRTAVINQNNNLVAPIDIVDILKD